MLRERARSGYLEVMASPGRTEPESVPIWLKLSEADAAQLDKVLARPEFAGWTKAEWCLEIIQTALRYYAKRPVAEPGQARAPARTAVTEPESPLPAPEPGSAPPKPGRAVPEPERAAPEREPAAPKRRRAAPERQRAVPKRGRAAPEPAAAVPEPPPQPECPHPADARDYQTGTCAACGAILWD